MCHLYDADSNSLIDCADFPTENEFQPCTHCGRSLFGESYRRQKSNQLEHCRDVLKQAERLKADGGTELYSMHPSFDHHCHHARVNCGGLMV